MEARRGSDHLPVLPSHVAIIMDGNGRWARRRALPRHAGHKAGLKPVRAIVEHCAELGIGTLTLFAFSSENWQRPDDEVRGLMALFIEALEREVDDLHASGVRLQFIGDRDALNHSLSRLLTMAEEKTRGNARLDLVVAVAYGGRWDLTQAARRLAEQVAAGHLEPRDIDEARFASQLTTSQLPRVDLLIRTGGERRISNFLLWDIAYSEVHFSDLLWPDFTTAELDCALASYAQCQRRFGRTGDQVEAVPC